MNQNSKTSEDTIDLKELFFSLIEQWKVIALCVVLSLICALLYLRVTPSSYSTDAMILVEDGKSAASAALLGNLGSLAGSVGGKSPADAEIEILNSRLILGQVIQNLNLNIRIEDNQNNLFDRLVSQDKISLDYKPDAVIYTRNQSSLLIKKLDVPTYYEDKPLVLSFIDQNRFNLSYKDEIVFKGNFLYYFKIGL